MKKILSIFLLGFMLLSACNSTKNTASTKGEKVSQELQIEKWIIYGEKAKCDESSEALCYQVKKGSNGDYEMFAGEIEGFSFEEGNKYQVEVKIVAVKNAPSKVVLVNELFKIPMK